MAAAEGKARDRFVLSDVAGAQGTVEQAALKNCRDRGGVECKIIQPEVCSLP